MLINDSSMDLNEIIKKKINTSDKYKSNFMYDPSESEDNPNDFRKVKTLRVNALNKANNSLKGKMIIKGNPGSHNYLNKNSHKIHQGQFQTNQPIISSTTNPMNYPSNISVQILRKPMQKRFEGSSSNLSGVRRDHSMNLTQEKGKSKDSGSRSQLPYLQYRSYIFVHSYITEGFKEAKSQNDYFYLGEKSDKAFYRKKPQNEMQTKVIPHSTKNQYNKEIFPIKPFAFPEKQIIGQIKRNQAIDDMRRNKYQKQNTLIKNLNSNRLQKNQTLKPKNLNFSK